MSDINERCGICGSKINEDEEKVYCPECGTPMHKSCWEKERCCPNADRHGTGFMWEAEQPKASASARSRGNMPICDLCGKELAPGDRITVCPDCGTPMHYECWERERRCPNEHRHAEDYDWEEEHSPIIGNRAQKEIQFLETFGREILSNPVRSQDSGEELTCCGVTQKELVHFLGKDSFSTPRFFSMFMNMANSGRKISINFASALFLPFYQFYRKMIGPAVILTLISFIINLPQIMMMNGYMSVGTADSDLISIAYILSFVDMGLKIAVLLFGDFLYMKWCVSKILGLREKYGERPESEYFEMLEKTGRPRFAYILLGIAVMFALTYIAMPFLR